MRIIAIILFLFGLGLGGWYFFFPRMSEEELYQKGMMLLSEGDWNGLRKITTELESRWPDSPVSSLLQGGGLIRQGELEFGLRLLEAIPAESTYFVQCLIFVFDARYQQGRFWDCQLIARRALSIDPENIEARRRLAFVYYDLGAMNHALDELNILKEKAPEDGRPQRLIGLIAKDQEQFSDAVDAYRDSLKNAPNPLDGSQIRIELAECLIQMQKGDEALETLDEIESGSLPPDQAAQVNVLKAEAYRARSDLDQAKQLVEQVLERSPGHPKALLLLGRIHLESGSAELAVEVLEKGVKEAPRDYHLNYQLSLAYRRANQEKEAEQFRKIADEIKALRQKFTQLHAQANEKPDDVSVRYQLGKTALALDLKDLARVWFMAALALNPEHSGSLRELGLLEKTPKPLQLEGSLAPSL